MRTGKVALVIPLKRRVINVVQLTGILLALTGAAPCSFPLPRDGAPGHGKILPAKTALFYPSKIKKVGRMAILF